jgi:MFS family permease
LALGSVFYAVAVGSVAFGYDFWGFWVSMVILTVGELILVPTSTTYVANWAPADMRGRYMSVYGLTWVFAMGVGPLLGGVLNDQFGPASIWYGGAFIGFLSVIGFIVLAKRFQSYREDRING